MSTRFLLSVNPLILTIRTDQIHPTSISSRLRTRCRYCKSKRRCDLPHNVLPHPLHVSLLLHLPPEVVLYLSIRQLGSVPEISYRHLMRRPQSGHGPRYRTSFFKLQVWIESRPRARRRQYYWARSRSKTIHRLCPKSAWIHRIDRSGSILRSGDSINASSPTMELRAIPTWSSSYLPHHWSLVRSRYSCSTSMADARILPGFPYFAGPRRTSHSTLCRIPTSTCYDPYPRSRNGRDSSRYPN